MGFSFFVFFSLEMWHPLRPKYPNKYENPNIWRKTTKNKNNKKKKLVRGSAGAHEVRVQNFTVLISRKRRGHLDSEGIWGVVLGTSLWCYSCGLRNTFFVDKSPCYSKMSVVGLILTRQGLFIRRILVSVLSLIHI